MSTITGNFVLLRDGGQALIRPVDPADRPAIEALFSRLSDESRALRFQSAGIRMTPATIDRALSGHVLITEINNEIVAVGSYARLRNPQRAEMALAVDDREHGRGIGTAMVEQLSRDARQEGVRRFIAEVLASNQPMQDMLAGLGFAMSRTLEHGVIEYDLELRDDSVYIESADRRRHVAAAASLNPLFQAQTIAVVGASRRPGSIGHELFHNLLSSGFAGTVYPVNPSATSVGAVRAYPSVAAIPEKIDLAIIVVPANVALDAARESLDAGVRGLVVISAGFAETGEAGRQRQAELLHMCRSRGARLIGPNCMGVLVSQPTGMLNGTFSPCLPPSGTVAVASQSGALGIAILQQARQIGIGISAFISMGNKADVSSNDLLEYWEDDPATSAIVLYLESFGNPSRFARVARRVGTRKPIIAVKGGRAAAGQRAAASHTAALAGSDVAVDALFRQAGVIRCDTLAELFDVTTLLANQPLPEGNRVGIITNAGGLGILCADACEANGLHLPTLTEATQERLRAMLPAEASVANPVDMLASGSAASYGQALQHVLADPGIDAAIILFIPPLVTNAADVAAAIAESVNPSIQKPVLACFVDAEGVPRILREQAGIPCYTFPEAAARALGHAAMRAEWLRRPVGEIPTFGDIDADSARAAVNSALGRDENPWLTQDELARVLATYGIPTPRSEIVHSPEEAAEAFGRIGGTVVAKLVSETITHKSDVGGVHLNIDTPEGAAEAYRLTEAKLAERGLSDALDGMLIQEMLTGGIECLVGVTTDPVFGPLIGFGLGGVTAEAIGDVAFRLQPLTDVDAEELIGSVKAARLLRGYRGSPPADIPALRNILLRISRLVEDIPEITDLDLNPVLVRPGGQGAVALDARLRVRRRES